MTIEEAILQFNTKTIQSSKNDNIVRISWRIYKNLSEKNRQILMKLNNRLDWNDIKPGDNIKYFSQTVVNQIEL